LEVGAGQQLQQQQPQQQPAPLSPAARRRAWVTGRALNVQREAAFNLALLLRTAGEYAQAMEVTALYLSYD
jgi:hypothetical protein